MIDESFLRLERLLRTETDATARSHAIDVFLEHVRYPITETDTTAVLLYRGKVGHVGLIGDMTDWADTIPLQRIPNTDLFYYRGTYEPDARLEYALHPEGQPGPAADPLNPYGVQSFLINSELAMPGYTRKPVFNPYLDGRKAGYELVRKEEIPPGALPYSHDVHVYLPRGYGTSDVEYPTVYLQDGSAYIENGATPAVFESLIHDRIIEPVIGVFVTPPNVGQPLEPNRITEYGMNDDYVRFFTDELVPFVERKFRTRRSQDSRMVVGDSYGGLISAYIAFRRPDVFGKVCSQSGYMSFRQDRLPREIEAKGSFDAHLFVQIGTYERRVARGIVVDEEGDFLLANRRFSAILERVGADVVYREYHEGHTWGNWRTHLIDALKHFFGQMAP